MVVLAIVVVYLIIGVISAEYNRDEINEATDIVMDTLNVIHDDEVVNLIRKSIYVTGALSWPAVMICTLKVRLKCLFRKFK